jgi:16S rRNA (guanine527-N7)-methyltransferase
MPVGPDRDAFVAWLELRHPSLPAETRDRLVEYGEAIAASHPRLGLVSRGDLGRVFMRHVRECLTPGLIELPARGARLADVGSGAGLPGIPLALLREDLEVCLIEPRERRAAFLERMVLTLRLTRTRVLLGTLERAIREHQEMMWDLALSRAVRWNPAMIEAISPRLDPAGVILRFGAPVPSRADVRVVPLDGDTPRAVQVWPREAWPDLPEAR